MAYIVQEDATILSYYYRCCTTATGLNTIAVKYIYIFMSLRVTGFFDVIRLIKTIKRSVYETESVCPQLNGERDMH
jgi:hypothetical protein